MQLRLEKCSICQSPVAQTDTVCCLCRNPKIFVEYILDIEEREKHKTALETHKKNWKKFRESIQNLLHKDWKNSSSWEKIWRQIEKQALELGFNKSATVKLSEIIWQEIETSNINKSPKSSEKETKNKSYNSNKIQDKFKDIKQSIAMWVDNLSKNEFDVVEWQKFVLSLNQDVSSDELEKIRDYEIARRFLPFETVNVSRFGELNSPQQRIVKRYIETINRQVEISLIKIPAGEFFMGDDNWRHTRPGHKVRISEFYLGRLPVTQAQWKAVAQLPKVKRDLEVNPSYFLGEDLAVDSVSWDEANEFCSRLSKHANRKYRLPSEAEWEYACRAGSNSAFTFGDTITPFLVNYNGQFPYGAAPHGEFRNKTIKAGFSAANAFGLSDMHGNLWEWCSDVWHPDYTGAPPTDGSAWIVGDNPMLRVLRGGAWCNEALLCRASERIGERSDNEGKLYYVGFRLALDL